jgi:hypothetical protein
MNIATFWTYDDSAIQNLNIYASNELSNYLNFKDEMFYDFYLGLIDRIQELKCYDC